LNHIDWTWPRERVRNIVRALAPPLPGAYANLDHEQLVLTRVELIDRPGHVGERPPGMVELVPGQAPLIWAADGPVAVLEFSDGDESRPGEHLVADGRLADGQILT
jgi:methionyl-tRNA formyltransferase